MPGRPRGPAAGPRSVRGGRQRRWGAGLQRRPRGGGDVSGHLRQGLVLRRGDGSRLRVATSGAARSAPDRAGHRGAAAGHQRLPLHPGVGGGGARCSAVHPDRIRNGRPGTVQVPGQRLSRQDGPGDASPVPR